MNRFRQSNQQAISQSNSLSIYLTVSIYLAIIHISSSPSSIGDRFVDMSIATKIKTYTNLIKQGL